MSKKYTKTTTIRTDYQDMYNILCIGTVSKLYTKLNYKYSNTSIINNTNIAFQVKNNCNLVMKRKKMYY